MLLLFIDPVNTSMIFYFFQSFIIVYQITLMSLLNGYAQVYIYVYFRLWQTHVFPEMGAVVEP